MKERPILFGAPMVCALLDGRKTQTRRIVKSELPDSPPMRRANGAWDCPYGSPGDCLYVRETWAAGIHSLNAKISKDYHVVYAADGDTAKQYRLADKWTPSIHMPRWASRILLEITDVRVERLQDISEDDAKAEGIEFIHGEFWRNYEVEVGDEEDSWESPLDSYKTLWQSINGPRTWWANPWVWVITFKRKVAE
jgi:hypothetical protein